MWGELVAASVVLLLAIAGAIKAVNSIATKFSIQMVSSMKAREEEHGKLLTAHIDNMKEQTKATTALKNAFEAQTNIIMQDRAAAHEKDKSLFAYLTRIETQVTPRRGG